MAEMATVTVFGPALELMKSVKSAEGEMLTKPFLDVCRNVLPVIGMYAPGGGSLMPIWSYRCSARSLGLRFEWRTQWVIGLLYPASQFSLRVLLWWRGFDCMSVLMRCREIWKLYDVGEVRCWWKHFGNCLWLSAPCSIDEEFLCAEWISPVFSCGGMWCDPMQWNVMWWCLSFIF